VTSATEARSLLDAVRTKELRMDDLLGEISRLVPVFVSKQTRYKVSELPDKRTIRYYVHKGLIDRPSHVGRNTVFLYRHLLQLLTVKKLQSGYIPLRKIEEITRSSSNEDLEDLLVPVEANRSIVLPAITLDRSDGLPIARSSSSALSGYSWQPCHKFRINDYLELHVDDGFTLSDPEVDLNAIVTRITQVLSLFSASRGGASGPLDDSPALAGKYDHSSDEARHLPFAPAPPVPSLMHATIALITEGGLVPKGNPDRLESTRSTRFLKYDLGDRGDLKGDLFESIDRGWDTTYVNEDPDRLLPLDVMHDLEMDRTIGKIHRYFYTTTGVATTVDAARKIGRGIAAELKKQGVSAAILTAT
jgi:DNA-binding transcriptional MerR regulator